MIPSNVIHRVFRIRYRENEASAFTLDVDNRQYMVTAKHAVEALHGSDTIDIFANGAWSPTPTQLVGHAHGERDISVLAINRQLTPSQLVMPATKGGVIYGQDVFFLGFPYGLLSKFTFTEHGYPLPLVKKAIVSLLQSDEVFLLDGHNNPGFSGGPVVFTEPGSREYRVFAVISGYKSIDQRVLAGGKQVYAGPDQPLVTSYNTGIIVAWAIDFAVQIARGNPVGAPLAS